MINYLELSETSYAIWCIIVYSVTNGLLFNFHIVVNNSLVVGEILFQNCLSALRRAAGDGKLDSRLNMPAIRCTVHRFCQVVRTVLSE